MPARWVAASNTSMKVLPMILRLRSGSVTPLSRCRNSREASSYCSLILKWRPKTSRTTSASRAAQQAVVDEDAGELVADGLVQQRRRHAGIHAAAQAENHPFLADLRADFLDRLLDVVAHRPVLAAAADAVDEVGEDLPPARRVDHLGMKLQAEESSARGARWRRKSEFSVTATGLKPVGQLRQLVAVRIPDLQRLRQLGEQRAAACP